MHIHVLKFCLHYRHWNTGRRSYWNQHPWEILHKRRRQNYGWPNICCVCQNQHRSLRIRCWCCKSDQSVVDDEKQNHRSVIAFLNTKPKNRLPKVSFWSTNNVKALENNKRWLYDGLYELLRVRRDKRTCNNQTLWWPTWWWYHWVYC